MSREKQMGKKHSYDEQALRASEEKYHTIFDSIDEGFVVAELLFDAGGKPFDLLVLETNASFDRLLRTTNAVGKRALEIFPSAEASWFEAFGHVVQTGESLRFENHLAALDSWFDLYISRIGEAGSDRFAIVFNDITKRKKAEQELKRTNELLQATLDGSLEHVQLLKAVRDQTGKIVDFVWLFSNKKWNDQWGEMAGKRLLQENPGVVEAGLFDKFVSVTESGVPIVHEQYYAHEQFNGWFLQSIVKVEDGFLITTLEITQRKLAEEALRASESQLARELEDTQQLQEISTLLIEEDNTETLHEQILNAAIALMHSDMGSLQMFDPERQELHLLAWKGFHPESAAYWETITGESFTICGRALRSGERQIVPDVNSPDFVTDSENRKQYRLSGIRAIQSTPLVSRDGHRLGMISTHWREPHVPGENELRRFDVLARQAADVLERARAEEHLRRSEERLRLIVESAKGYAVFTTDADGFINSWNAGAAHIFGWNETEILGQNADVLFTPEDRAAGEPQKELETAQTQGIAPDIRWHQRKDGSRVFINGEVRPLRDEQKNGFVKIGRDLTAQRQAEEALRENQKQLQLLNETLEQKVQEKTTEVRELASDLIKATQQERHRISHLLHDDLQQSIYAIQMQMTFLIHMLKDEKDAARKEALDIAGQLNEILEMTRQLSIDLSPPILRGEGLWHAINWLAGRMQQRYGLPIDLQAEGSFVIPGEELHVLLFNCVRELLFNVVKHAKASQALVSLEWVNDSRLQIEVRDNGKGFPPDHAEQPVTEDETQPESLGLSTIRHQLSLFNGTMEIRSAPGAGTQVILTVPIPQDGSQVSS